jgi:hypothetical protein
MVARGEEASGHHFWAYSVLVRRESVFHMSGAMEQTEGHVSCGINISAQHLGRKRLAISSIILPVTVAA